MVIWKQDLSNKSSTGNTVPTCDTKVLLYYFLAPLCTQHLPVTIYERHIEKQCSRWNLGMEIHIFPLNILPWHQFLCVCVCVISEAFNVQKHAGKLELIIFSKRHLWSSFIQMVWSVSCLKRLMCSMQENWGHVHWSDPTKKACASVLQNRVKE